MQQIENYLEMAYCLAGLRLERGNKREGIRCYGCNDLLRLGIVRLGGSYMHVDWYKNIKIDRLVDR